MCCADRQLGVSRLDSVPLPPSPMRGSSVGAESTETIYDGHKPAENLLHVGIFERGWIEPEVCLNNLPERLDALICGQLQAFIFDHDLTDSLDNRTCRGEGRGRIIIGREGAVHFLVERLQITRAHQLLEPRRTRRHARCNDAAAELVFHPALAQFTTDFFSRFYPPVLVTAAGVRIHEVHQHTPEDLQRLHSSDRVAPQQPFLAFNNAASCRWFARGTSLCEQALQLTMTAVVAAEHLADGPCKKLWDRVGSL